MKILILGAGAMGGIFGGYLKGALSDVVLLDPWPEHVAAINSRGLQIEKPDGEVLKIPVTAVTSPQDVALDVIDLIIVFVKSYHADQALSGIKPLIGPSTRLLTLQNGVGNGEKLAEYADREMVYVGGTALGGRVLSPGTVKHAAVGETFIGKLTGGKDDFLSELEKVFNNAGIPSTALDDTNSVIWSKLIINVAFNALTALTRLKNKDFVAQDEGKRLMAMVVEETVLVARKKGIPLAFEDPLAHCLKIGATTIGENTTSMLNDVLHDRMAEIETINGAVVAEGKKLGIPTPANEVVTLLVKTIHKTYGIQIRPNAQ